MWIVSIILVGLASVSQFVFPEFWLPWAANVGAMAIPLFHIGTTFGHRIFRPRSVRLGRSCLCRKALFRRRRAGRRPWDGHEARRLWLAIRYICRCGGRHRRLYARA
jgi:hypothetical protein